MAAGALAAGALAAGALAAGAFVAALPCTTFACGPDFPPCNKVACRCFFCATNAARNSSLLPLGAGAFAADAAFSFWPFGRGAFAGDAGLASSVAAVFTFAVVFVADADFEETGSRAPGSIFASAAGSRLRISETTASWALEAIC